MKPYLLSILFLTLLAGCSCQRKSAAEKPAQVIWTEMDTIPPSFGGISKGVSAAFVGFHHGKLIVAGGCNFPEVPAANGGKKVFYRDVLSFDGNTWTKIGELPHALAYGASINLPEGLICIGGRNNDYFSSSAVTLKIDKKSGKLLIDSLFSLPVKIDNFGSAVLDSVIYVLGGNQNGVPSAVVWALDLRTSKGWVKLPSIPSRPLIQPAVTAQNGTLYVFGGYDNPRKLSPLFYSDKSTNDTAAFVSQAVWKYLPTTKTWTRAVDYPAGKEAYSLSGGVAVAVSDNLILTFSGVNQSVFEEALNRNLYLNLYGKNATEKVVEKLSDESKTYLFHTADWYKFNPNIMLFNTTNNTWQSLGHFPQVALAGTSVVNAENIVYVVNGEIKPGIRTPKIGKITWITTRK